MEFIFQNFIVFIVVIVGVYAVTYFRLIFGSKSLANSLRQEPRHQDVLKLVKEHKLIVSESKLDSQLKGYAMVTWIKEHQLEFLMCIICGFLCYVFFAIFTIIIVGLSTSGANAYEEILQKAAQIKNNTNHPPESKIDDGIQPKTQMQKETLSIANEIMALKTLRDSGDLSSQEFEMAKQKLLNRAA
jgi:predicted PurR-regulated permease PerM